MIASIVGSIIGFSEGIVVGTALIAFITILDIVPRLAQLTKTEKYIRVYEYAMIISGVSMVLIDVLDVNFNISSIGLGIIGLLMGLYVGLFASALTEITNVIPIIVKAFNLHGYEKYVFYALIFGKVVGSFLYWLYVVS
ncbi:MAG: stage V sporulation protein AB [Anaeromicrobium sp.]|jgi:stage V sporulation protein AB|uniref:stage V sporulation protein AB n=1 Tax=Anaeromicrobium sp. TaxID=1929132 RepID=UPI0025D74EAA|nr:stage V sporulation protein AB [Anaeromicrobium sp.]MCT4593315.1 stage V sporulation protein AB [Anaeromicrobium sp.]